MAEGGREERDRNNFNFTPTKEDLERKRREQIQEEVVARQTLGLSPFDPDWQEYLDNSDEVRLHGDGSFTPNSYLIFNPPLTPAEVVQTPNEVSIGGDSATNAGLMDSSTPNEKAPKARAKLEFGDVGELEVDADAEISQLCASLDDLVVAEDGEDKEKAKTD